MERIEKGTAAPSFTLKDQNGKDVSLEDFKGKKVLVYFYPKADTPGCTTQSCEVEKARSGFASLHTVVLGISPDPVDKQKKFALKYNLEFPLLSDTEHKTAESFGVWTEKKMFGKTYMGILRSSFLIDEEGTVIDSWYKVSPGNTVPYAMKVLTHQNS